MSTYLEAPKYALSTSYLFGTNIIISTISADTVNLYSSISGITTDILEYDFTIHHPTYICYNVSS